MFSLAKEYASRGMSAYADLQEQEFAAEKVGGREEVFFGNLFWGEGGFGRGVGEEFAAEKVGVEGVGRGF